MLSKRYEFGGKPAIKLNSIQKRGIAEFAKKKYTLISRKYCPICAKKDFEELSGRDRYGLAHKVVICTHCGLAFADPYFDKSSLLKFYAEDYRGIYSGHDSTKKIAEDYAKQMKKGRKIYNFIEENYKKVTGKRVVEIGTGAGGVLRHFQENRNDVMGVDFGEEYLNFGKRRGLELYCGGTEELVKKGVMADALLYADALEHIPYIETELSSAKKILKDDGFLFVGLPSIKNLAPYRGNFLRQLQNAHAYYFSLQTLHNMMAKNGFSPIYGDESIYALYKKSPSPAPFVFVNDYSAIKRSLAESEKSKLVFVLYYIGTLRYFEKLIPYLRDKYDISFLFMQEEDEPNYIPEMIAYCSERGYAYNIISKHFAPAWTKNFSLLDAYLAFRHAKQEFTKFFEGARVKKVICSSDMRPYINYFLQKAEGSGADTFLLQWGISGEDIDTTPGKELPIVKLSRAICDNAYHLTKGLMLKYIFGCKVTRKAPSPGMGNARRVGAISEFEYESFKNAGVDAKKLSIVGYIDSDLAQKNAAFLDKNTATKQELARKYGINTDKKNILLLSTPFNIRDITVFSDAQQLAYYEEIILAIRRTFSSDEADILLKVHPAEDINLYRPLEKYGVKLYEKTSPTEDLIYFSNLYLGRRSTANFIPLAMDKEAIFLNFTNIPVSPGIQKAFGIKKMISDEREFQKLLGDFKKGNLEKQYDESVKKKFVRNSVQKIVNWIG